MSLLTKDQILQVKDNQTIEVEVPEWGGKVKLQSMSGFARDRFEASIVGKQGGMNTTNIRAKLVAACVIDANGELMFSEKEVAALGKKSAKALDRIFSAAQKLNAMGDSEIESLAKN